MKNQTLKTRILLSFFIVILFLGVIIALHRIYVIKHNIIDRAQQQVKNDLKVALYFYSGQIELMQTAFNFFVFKEEDLSRLKENLGLDYLYAVEKEEIKQVESEIVKRAFQEKKGIGGTRIIGEQELQKMGPEVVQKSNIPVHETLLARPSDLRLLRKAMAIDYAQPILDGAGNVEAIIYGGRILNRDYALVDKIRNSVFENQFYQGRPVGTVTIFLDDIRVATNVLNKAGERAIGTRVSKEVYDIVIGSGQTWLDRAFVVTDWYLTAYEPIKNIEGKIIGILYVGILEKPFTDLQKNILVVLFLLMVLAIFLAMVLSYILASSITQPVTQMLNATQKVSQGNLEFKLRTTTSIRELDELAASFNEMAQKVKEREDSLEISNQKLTALNKSYLDLIGFVTHELKGILASLILNAYAVRDGILGLINPKQRQALDAVAKNLEYFDATVKNFLNLSRIEKGEMSLDKKPLRLKRDVFDLAIESFMKQAEEKEMQITNNLSPDLTIMADGDMLQIVADNLVGNAIKYGKPSGKIVFNSQIEDGQVQVEVYNDGRPIRQEEKERLFKKFSRLNTPGAQKSKGTGLGLFITKEIIEKHGGTIWVEPREEGNSFIFRIEGGALS